MRAVEDVAGLWNLFYDDFQVRHPHVRTDVADISGAFGTRYTEKAQQRMYGELWRYMQKAAAVSIAAMGTTLGAIYLEGMAGLYFLMAISVFCCHCCLCFLHDSPA